MWRQGTVEDARYHFEVEGKNLKECDNLALQRFRSESEKLDNIHEGMDVVRIDIPATTEKTTFLAKNGRQEYKTE